MFRKLLLSTAVLMLSACASHRVSLYGAQPEIPPFPEAPAELRQLPPQPQDHLTFLEWLSCLGSRSLGAARSATSTECK